MMQPEMNMSLQWGIYDLDIKQTGERNQLIIPSMTKKCWRNAELILPPNICDGNSIPKKKFLKKFNTNFKF